MSLLDSAIQELLVVEPFWQICYPCRFHGFCCIGARLDITDVERRAINEYVGNLPLQDQEQIRDNKAASRHCVYRTADKCLIHDVRPENCRYTPFQAVIETDGVLRYTMVRIGASGHCEFRSVVRRLPESQACLGRSHKFLLLPNFDRSTRYLSLNWLVAREQDGTRP